MTSKTRRLRQHKQYIVNVQDRSRNDTGICKITSLRFGLPELMLCFASAPSSVRITVATSAVGRCFDSTAAECTIRWRRRSMYLVKISIDEDEKNNSGNTRIVLPSTQSYLFPSRPAPHRNSSNNNVRRVRVFIVASARTPRTNMRSMPMVVVVACS